MVPFVFTFHFFRTTFIRRSCRAVFKPLGMIFSLKVKTRYYKHSHIKELSLFTFTCKVKIAQKVKILGTAFLIQVYPCQLQSATINHPDY